MVCREINLVNMKNKKLIAWCKKHRFTSPKLANELGVKTYSTVWEWKNRGRQPHADTMKKFTALIARVDKKPFPAEKLFQKPTKK